MCILISVGFPADLEYGVSNILTDHTTLLEIMDKNNLKIKFLKIRNKEIK